MKDFAFKVYLVALVRVRAADESVAPKVVPTVLGAPSTVEIGLANENNAATGRHASITDVDFSIGSVKPFWGQGSELAALRHFRIQRILAAGATARTRSGRPRLAIAKSGPSVRAWKYESTRHPCWFWCNYVQKKVQPGPRNKTSAFSSVSRNRSKSGSSSQRPLG